MTISHFQGSGDIRWRNYISITGQLYYQPLLLSFHPALSRMDFYTFPEVEPMSKLLNKYIHYKKASPRLMILFVLRKYSKKYKEN